MKPITRRIDKQSRKMRFDPGDGFVPFIDFQNFVAELPFRRDHSDHGFDMDQILVKAGNNPFALPYILKHHGPPLQQSLKYEIVHYPPFWFDPIPCGSKWTIHPAAVFCTLPNDTLPKCFSKIDHSPLTYNFVHKGSNADFDIEND